MNLTICPRCTKTFYAEETSSITCTACGFSSQLRKEIRIKAEMDLALYIYGVSRTARIRDYSSGGTMITYDGPALPADSRFDLEIKEMKIKRSARTVWTKETFEDRHESGLQLYC